MAVRYLVRMLTIRSRRFLAFALLVVACANPTRAQFGEPVGGSAVASPPRAPQLPGVEHVLEIASRDNRAMETVRTLTRDHPKRLTGSRGFDRAAAWAKEQFTSYGLDARLEKWGEFPVAFDRGVQKGRIVSPAVQDLIFMTSAWSAGTHGAQRGRALLEPKTEADFLKLATSECLAGAWIVRGESQGDAKFKGKLREAYEAARIAGIVRSGPKSGLLVMSGNWRVDPEKLPRNVDIRVQADQFDGLTRRLERGEEIELEFDVENEFTRGPVDCHNVVADIQGTRFPHEFVLVQGHLDAWDGAQGAQDNGTGTATTMEAARLIALSGQKPLRTIRFVLYSGEEEGIQGSEGYVRDHASELASTSVVLTHDAGGTFLAGIDATYAMWDDVERVCAPIESLDPRRPFSVREVMGLENTWDSDHAPFLTAGVPSFFWHQSEIGYEHVHHTQHDVLDAIDAGDLEHSAVVVAVTALGFANLDHKLDRADSQAPPRRLLGVQLDHDATIQTLTKSGRAAMAGWKALDRIVSIDGRSVSNKNEAIERLQQGVARKSFKLTRGNETIETVIDYSDDKAELERSARADRRTAFLNAHPRAAAR